MIQTVSINGRISVNNSDEMRRKLQAALGSKPAQVTVDLSGATYIDTSGVATLLEAVRIARGQGTRFILAGLNGQPRYLFEAAEFDRLFEIAPQEASM